MTEEVPFVDLRQQYLKHQKLFEKAFREICISGAYILGPELERFEKKFADFIGVKESVGVGTGTDALHLAFQALGMGPGDEVLIPANTFIATGLSVIHLGATVVVVDINPGTYLMDMADAEKKTSLRTKAIVPVHLYGQSMDMDSVMAFAKNHDLEVIEDACQSHGAMHKGRYTGSFGTAGCFSFYPGKNLGAFGDGGLITTDSQKIADQVRLLRNYGSTRKYVHEILGTNSRLDSLQAAVLNIKLDFLEQWNRKRFRAACRYADRMKNIQEIQVPQFNRDESQSHVFHLFVITCDRRDGLLEYLNAHSIQCGIHYPVPFHLHEAFRSNVLLKGEAPVSEMISKRILSLPIFPEITDDQIDKVVDRIKSFYAK